MSKLLKHINSYSPSQRRLMMQQKLATIVAKHNGQFNKNEYFNKRSVITFSCEKKHQWSVQAQSVFNGSWCKECFILFKAGKHLVLRNGLQQAQKIADDRNGLCLSEKYVNSHTPLLWRCSNGHQWSAVISDVKKGTWCPHCSVGVRERLCRFYFESFTGKAFPKTKPDWLLNSNGNRMELDGYCNDLKIAFEHQGQQHYKKIEHFNRRNESLDLRKQYRRLPRQVNMS